MAMLQSRRLEGLLGGSLESVTVAQVRALVDIQVVEAFDLDFKEGLYGRGDSEKRDLAGDVAALANTAGGLIIIGVAEDDQARASAAPGVEVTDGEVARIRQIVASGVSPLPAFDVMIVLDDMTPGLGFLLIAVPRSVIAPHAVLINDALRFPTRNGATTRYLSEPEVAAAYRARLTSAAQRGERPEHVEKELTSNLGLTDEPWIAVTLVPELPGDFAISRASFAEFETSARGAPIVPLYFGGMQLRRVEVGHRRLRADDSILSADPAPWGVAVELHTDGSGVIALRLHDVGQSRQATDPTTHTVSNEGIAAALIGSLQYLAQHARDRAHASGMAALLVTVLPSTVILGVALGEWRRGFSNTVGRVLTSVPPASTYAEIDELADGGPGLVAAAARLHHAIGHSFGIPELPQLTLGGELVWPFWSRESHPQLAAWAKSNGVKITREPTGG